MKYAYLIELEGKRFKYIEANDDAAASLEAAKTGFKVIGINRKEPCL